MNGKIKKMISAATLAAMLASGPAAQAYVDPAAIEIGVEGEELARTQADWKKLLTEYRAIDCNFEDEFVEAMLEIEDFIETTYPVYFSEELPNTFKMDDIIAYRRASVDQFGFRMMVADWNALDKNNEQAVVEFLEKYGKYLVDIHAHNYFILINIISAIRNDLAWYVKQDVENSDFIRNEFGFDTKEFQGGTLADDLTHVGLNYTDGANTYDIDVNVTAPNDANETIGDGFVDIQTVYGNCLREVKGLEKLMNTGEYSDNFYGGYCFATYPDGVVNGEQVYQIDHNADVRHLVEEGIRVIKTFNPAVTYNELLEQGYNVTPLGYGHWFIPAENNYTYDEATHTYRLNYNETFECPTTTVKELTGQELTLK